MAVEADVIAIVNKAFVLIGDNKITSLAAGGEQEDIAEIYDTRLEELLGMGRWRFATKQAELSRNVTNPLSKWEGAYDLPDGDPDEVIMAIYGVSVDGENIPFDRYGDQIYCNASLQDAVILDYQYRPAEALFPARFKSALIDLLAADFILPKSASASDRLYNRGIKKAKEALSMNAQERTARKLPVHAFTKTRRFWAPGSTYPATGGASGAGGGNLLSDGVYGPITILNGVWSFTDNSVDLDALMSADPGDILYWNALGNPTLLNVGSNGQVLTLTAGLPTWQTPSGGSGISDGDYGDITVSGAGTVLSIDAGVINNAKLASNAVDTTNLVNDSVTLAKIAAATAGDILYWNGSGNPVQLGIGTSGQVLTASAGGLPVWSSGGSGSLSSYLQIRDEKTANTAGGTFTSGAWRTRDLNTESWNAITGAGLLYLLPFDGGSGGAPAAGETITGGTSGATATVWRATGSGVSGTAWVYNVSSGPFQDNEVVTSSGSMNALVNNLTPEDSGTGCNYAHSFVLPAGTFEVDASAPAHNVTQHKAKLYNFSNSANQIIGTTEFADTDNSTTTTNRSVIRGRFTIAAAKEYELQHRSTSTQATNGFGYPANYSVVEVYTDIVIRQVS